MKNKYTRALLLVVSAPSGAGKSTICNQVIRQFSEMTYSVSCTTRSPRGDEKNHVHYHFLSREEFSERIEKGDFLEYAEVHGHFYGTLKETVRETLEAGRDLIMDIDVQGAAQIREACDQLSSDDPVRKGFVDVFISPPSMEELKRRLCDRATDEKEVIERRLCNAKIEMEERNRYQYLIVNDDLNRAVENFVNVICSEREKTH